MESKRCFIALDLSRDAINEIKRIQELIRKQNMFTGKFTEPENLHLTLKFLGEIDEKKIEDVKKRLKKVKLKCFDIHFGIVGVFTKRFIKIIWVELRGAGELQGETDDRLKDLFDPEYRFMGHVTLARVKYIKNKEKLLNYINSIGVKKINFKVDKFFLKESQLLDEGPVYTDIEEYNLEK